MVCSICAGTAKDGCDFEHEEDLSEVPQKLGEVFICSGCVEYKEHKLPGMSSAEFVREKLQNEKFAAEIRTSMQQEETLAAKAERHV